jgi:hypothetical protein
MPYSSQVERRPHGCCPRTPESLCISIAERSRLMLRPSNVTLKEYQHADTEENNERWPSDLVTPFWLVETSGRFYEQAVVIRRWAPRSTQDIRDPWRLAHRHYDFLWVPREHSENGRQTTPSSSTSSDVDQLVRITDRSRCVSCRARSSSGIWRA